MRELFITVNLDYSNLGQIHELCFTYKESSPYARTLDACWHVNDLQFSHILGILVTSARGRVFVYFQTKFNE